MHPIVTNLHVRVAEYLEKSRDRPIYQLVWFLPIYRYRPKWPILLASVCVDKTLPYSSRIQTTCARKDNKPSHDIYLAATLTGAFSQTSKQDGPWSMHRSSQPKEKHHH